MLSQRQLFMRHLAQTSAEPIGIEITHARGVELFGPDHQSYLDLISGISVSNVGHCHPDVVEAVCKQAQQHMHVMVYGELIQSPQVDYVTSLTKLLPEPLSVAYLVNSGSEAIEGALKLAKRFTGRSEIISFQNGYHGSTHGALSLNSNEYFKNSFRPLLPAVRHIPYNAPDALKSITSQTACVVAEAVQGEAGCVVPDAGFLKSVRKQCDAAGALLILDEIQTGFGRTGPFMAFMDAGIVPDILVLAKGMAGGMPLGAFLAAPDLMGALSHDPVLGHITTFGGHPVSCAAAAATLGIVAGIPGRETLRKEALFRERLVHPEIAEIRGKGLLLAVRFRSETLCKQVITRCIRNGVMTDWFLFAPDCMRIAPPLVIEDHHIFMACEIILRSLEEVLQAA